MIRKFLDPIYCLFRKYGIVLGVDLPYFVKNGFWMILEKAFLIAKGFLLSLLFANLLDKEIFGQYQYVLSILGIMSSLILPGMSVSVIQAVAKGREKTYNSSIKMMIRWGILGSIALLLVSFYSFYAGQRSIALILLAFVWIFPFYGTMNMWRSYYTGKEWFGKMAWHSLLSEAFTLMALVLAVYFFDSLAVLVFAATIIPMLFYGYYTQKTLSLSGAGSEDSTDLEYGKKLSFVYGISIVAGYIDKLVVGQFLGFSELALYAIVSVIPDQIKSGMRIFLTLLLPKFSKIENTEKNRRFVLKNIIRLLFLSTLIVGAYIFAVPFLFKWFFPKYAEGIIYSQVIAAGFILTPFMIIDSFFRAHKKNKAISRSTLWGNGIGIVIAVLAIPVWGIWGAVISKIANIGINSFYLLFVFITKRDEN